MSRMNSTYALALSIAVLSASIGWAETKVAVETKMSPTEAAVRAVVTQHIDGIVQADVKKLEQAWDTKAGRITSVQVNKDGAEVVTSKPITEAFELWTAGKQFGSHGAIRSVDIVNDKMALVKAQITWRGQVFEDYLVLLKTEQGWRLVSKTYTSKKMGSLYG